MLIGWISLAVTVGAWIACSVFEVRFRFYGPEKPLFDKTWKLGDIEEVT